MTPSEQFVYELSLNACLSLWTYANPKNKESGNELCDVLVVCQPDIIIFSVKEIELKSAGNLELRIERWKRAAVNKSVKQIYGAERAIAKIDEVTTADLAAGVALGDSAQRRIYRIAVAIGSGGSVPLESKDFAKGLVHVFDEETLLLLLRELDTISDLVHYLSHRETLIQTLNRVLFVSEADLLAVYLQGNRSFDLLTTGSPDIQIVSELWTDFVKSPQFLAKKREDEISYVWDRLINYIHENHAKGEMEYGGDLASVDGVTRAMARENRLYRRALSKAFTDFMDSDLPARQALSRFGTSYVFLKRPHTEPRKERLAELSARCLVTRDDMENRGQPGRLIGLATEIPADNSGFSIDTILIDVPAWTSELRESAKQIREDTGYFKNPTQSSYDGQEYPKS